MNKKPKKTKKNQKKRKFQTVAGLLQNGQKKCPKPRNELLDEHHFFEKNVFAMTWRENETNKG